MSDTSTAKPAPKRWIIYGATGTTGQGLIELAVAAGMSPILAGRNEKKLRHLAEPHGLEVRVTEHSLVALTDIFSDVQLVASCVGPYSRFGLPVVNAAIECGAHYIDFNGEPRFYHHLIEKLDSKAKKNGSVAVPSAGLGVCSSLAAAIASRGLSSVERLTVIYELSGVKPSTGTAQSMFDIFSGGAPVVDKNGIRFVRFGRRLLRSPRGISVTFPLTDPLALSRAWPNCEIQSVQRSPLAPFIWLTSPLFALAKYKKIQQLLHYLQARTTGSDADEASGIVKITVAAKSTNDLNTTTVSVSNMYELTSRAGFEVMQSLLDHQWPAGIRGAGQVLPDPEKGIQSIGAVLTENS